MTKKARVNVRSVANVSKATKTTRNGREIMIVPSATLPDNAVMNGIMYPADEIEASYRGLDRTPAPHGHPMIDNNFVSASDPEGINIGYIGAWNENPRREGGRVFLDKVIDVEVAKRTDDGKAVLDAVNAGEPVHTSTGLYLDMEEAGNGDGYDYIARNMKFDHDAILLKEEAAATPEQGVGMMVNAKGEQEQIEVINSAIDMAESDLDWAADMAARAVERMERAPLLERIKSAIMEAVTGSDGRETSANDGDAEMADEKQLEALSAKVNAIEESLNGLGDKITNAVTEAVKPIKDHVDQIEANQKAEAEAEKAELVSKVVKANVLEEAEAKELTLNALRSLAKKAEPGQAAPINGAFGGNANDDPWAGYSINSHANTGRKEAS